jgi:hypothetical protein
MSVVPITSGAHWRNVDIPSDADCFAHIFDPESPEDVPHQAQNFLLYAAALGGCKAIVVARIVEGGPEWVIPTEEPASRHVDPEDDHVAVMLSDWAAIVQSATGIEVEVR